MTTLTELKTAIKLAEEPTKVLLNRIYDFCRTKRKTPDEVFSAPIPPALLKLWQPLRDSHPFKPAETLPVNDLINTTFYVTRRDKAQSHCLYPVRDAKLKLLAEPIIYDTLSNSCLTDVGLALNTTIGKLDNVTVTFNQPKEVKEALATYFMSPTAQMNHATPINYAQPEDDTWCMSKRTVEPDDSVECPGWQRFLGTDANWQSIDGVGFEDPEAYAAKVYAIVTGKDTSRQALVVRSKGKTGKTCAMDAITSIYGNDNVAKAITGTHVSQSSRFLASNYTNAALIYAPDCNTRTFLLSEVVKLLTGSDTVQYEIKNGGYGEFKAKAKLIVHMNPVPQVLSDEHSRSRILYLQQEEVLYEDQGVEAYTAQLRAELPGFLAYGERCFAKRWRNNKVTLNDAAQRTFDNLVGNERQEFFDFLLSKYEFNPASKLDGADFTKDINRVRSLSQWDRDQWREWLAECEEVEMTKNEKGRVTYIGIGKRRAGTVIAAADEMERA